ncbi:hypothetical protein [Nocardia sp. NBC_01329]|uniref:hypothetical protein n=1 Tax=Nocardia sp. NBC_01329 TaxID=2903594 RepID=UPI002E142FD6|nr:hypothetical protein OG405_19120 [Nocardia sp. NBC_01329]
MTRIRFPDPESIDEITSRFLLSMPTASLPMLYGFRCDNSGIDAECVAVDLTGHRRDHEPNPVHLRAAQLRNTLGTDMFGFGLVFVVFADQLRDRPENRHIPERVRVAAEQLPGIDDLLVAVVIDARGRQWWAVAARHLPDLDPVRIHTPATRPENWCIPKTLDASLWTAALALDDANHPKLRCLRQQSSGNG